MLSPHAVNKHNTCLNTIQAEQNKSHHAPRPPRHLGSPPISNHSLQGSLSEFADAPLKCDRVTPLLKALWDSCITPKMKSHSSARPWRRRDPPRSGSNLSSPPTSQSANHTHPSTPTLLHLCSPAPFLEMVFHFQLPLPASCSSAL